MVQLLVRLGGSGGEWGLVELQGQLETRDQAPFDNMHIGDLHFDSKGSPNLVVGHHLLTGKVMELEKPFAVLKKRSVPIMQPRDDSEHEEINTEQSEMEPRTGMGLQAEFGAKTKTEYEVVALITKKVIFKNRPKPIITKPLPRRM